MRGTAPGQHGNTAYMPHKLGEIYLNLTQLLDDHSLSSVIPLMTDNYKFLVGQSTTLHSAKHAMLPTPLKLETCPITYNYMLINKTYRLLIGILLTFIRTLTDELETHPDHNL